MVGHLSGSKKIKGKMVTEISHRQPQAISMGLGIYQLKDMERCQFGSPKVKEKLETEKSHRKIEAISMWLGMHQLKDMERCQFGTQKKER
jgi:hypothetical protein